MREQIKRLQTLLQKSRDSIGLNQSHFEAAITSSLQLLKSSGLQPDAKIVTPDGTEVASFAFPAVDERSGADPSWAETMDTLRVPRRRDQKLWDWRKSSPIRSVVFQDSGTVGDEFVHLHLEQRVVQRLLGRFTAQGFVHHDLSRACFAQATDSIPRVVLLGRLCLYGEGAARLHEELIPVTARWIDPNIRKGLLSPYAKVAETKTMGLLDQSLLQGTGIQLTPEVVSQLQQSAAEDIRQLLPHLETRGGEYAADANRKLAERGQAEAKAMREILETIRDELKTESDRIASLYNVQAKRIEPVGLCHVGWFQRCRSFCRNQGPPRPIR